MPRFLFIVSGVFYYCFHFRCLIKFASFIKDITFAQTHNMKIKSLFITTVLFVVAYTSFAQKRTITGKITDAATGIPMQGVSVTVMPGGAGTVSAASGTFSVQAADGDRIEFTYIGYGAVSISIKGQTNLEVKMESATTDLGQIVLVGSRSGGRIKTESPVPVDIIKINEAGNTTARMDLTSVLNYTAPSYNYNKQSGADGADHIDLGTLRGLGPDQTLVLINGKRRHQTAFVGLFGTRGRGNSGSDMNAFPEAAVDRIEILRDGASAQYGSDAMAGVINVVLKKDVNHWTINTGLAGYYDHKFNSLNTEDPTQYYTGSQIDGGTFSLSINNGLSIGKNGGFINFSADIFNQGKTYRQVDTTNWQTDKWALPYINTSRRAFGDGSVTSGGAFINMEIPFSANKKTIFYAFGGYNYKAAEAYAYSRNYSARPDRFPINEDGSLIFVDGIMRKSSDGETYYNPIIQTHIQDASVAAGVRGDVGNGWNWDLSNTFGGNNFHYYGDKTFNASDVGNVSQTKFDDGGFYFYQNTINLDFSKAIKSVAQGMNLGLGAEVRFDKYKIYDGEAGSYKTYPNEFGQAGGSQGFPGFSPNDVVDATRTNEAIYVDAELNATKELLLDGALRFENYSDFGSVLTYKLATRYKVTHNFNFRGSISTGFRAPSLQQINFSNTLTSFVAGVLVQSRIANNNDPITRAAGIPKLKEETSVNGSLGFTWKPITWLTFTVDGYWIKVKDRIVLSGLFSADDPTLPATLTDELKALDVSTAQFFANAVNTTNTGLDVVIDYNKKWGNQSFRVLFAGNFQNMKVDDVNVPAPLATTTLNTKTFFSDREKAFLIASAPKSKFSLGLDYGLNKFGIGTHLTYFGKVTLLGFGTGTEDNPYYAGINPQVPSDADPNVLVPENFVFSGKLVTDVYTSYKVSKNATVFLGVDNLMNVHPDLGVNPLAKTYPFDNESGGPWDSVQMGFNGMRLFGKIALNF